jgi:hypothetical protein
VAVLRIAVERKLARNQRKVAVMAPQVRNLLKQVAKAAQVNKLRDQSGADTTDCSKSQTRTILIPVI